MSGVELRMKYKFFWMCKVIRGWSRLGNNACPMCNSDAPELDNCPICDGYHQSKGDEYPPDILILKGWSLLYRQTIDASLNMKLLTANSRKKTKS